MAFTQSMCTQFKKDVFLGLHDLESDTIKIALYTSSANLDSTTDTYTTSNEVANGNGYTTGGLTLSNTSVIENGTSACFDCNNPEWTSSSFTVRGALIYNATAGNKAIVVLDFSGEITVSSGTFSLVLPAPIANNAIIRID